MALTSDNPNRKKRKEITRLSIADAADKGAMLGLAPMSLENANKAMKRVDAFSKWAEKNYFDGPGLRPLEGMAFKIQESAQDKRYSFSTAQLTQISTLLSTQDFILRAHGKTGAVHEMRHGPAFGCPC